MLLVLGIDEPDYRECILVVCGLRIPCLVLLGASKESAALSKGSALVGGLAMTVSRLHEIGLVPPNRFFSY